MARLIEYKRVDERRATPSSVAGRGPDRDRPRLAGRPGPLPRAAPGSRSSRSGRSPSIGSAGGSTAAGPGSVRRLLERLYWLAFRVIETLTGISIPKSVRVGPGLRIWHFGNIFVHADGVIGANCTLRQGVTIGNREDGGPCRSWRTTSSSAPMPRSSAGVRVGRGAKVGAMSVVLRDVPPGAVAVGVPARIIERSPTGPRPDLERGDDAMKAALIGTGHIARQHLACLRELPGVEVAGRLRPLARRWPSPPPSGSACPPGSPTTGAMLAEARPDVVHVTTPPPSHFPLAMDALEAGAHVVVEKPATATFDELAALVDRAAEAGRALVEDYNYIFNGATQAVLRLVDSGEFGDVVARRGLQSASTSSARAARSATRTPPTPACDGGRGHRRLPDAPGLAGARLRRAASGVADDLVKRRPPRPCRATSSGPWSTPSGGRRLLGFSASTQPDAFWLRVDGTRMQAVANLFETRLTIDRLRGGPRRWPALNGLREAQRRAAVGVRRPLAQARRRPRRV